jgi:hypothetical protein
MTTGDADNGVVNSPDGVPPPTADRCAITFAVGHVLDYRDTAEIARILAPLRTLGFVPLAEYRARPHTVPGERRHLPSWCAGGAMPPVRDGRTLVAQDGCPGIARRASPRGTPGLLTDRRRATLVP